MTFFSRGALSHTPSEIASAYQRLATPFACENGSVKLLRENVEYQSAVAHARPEA